MNTQPGACTHDTLELWCVTWEMGITPEGNGWKASHTVRTIVIIATLKLLGQPGFINPQVFVCNHFI